MFSCLPQCVRRADCRLPDAAFADKECDVRHARHCSGDTPICSPAYSTLSRSGCAPIMNPSDPMLSVAYTYLRRKAADYGLFPDTRLGRLTLALLVIDLLLVVLRK